MGNYREQEWWGKREDKDIYGKLFLPEGLEDGRPRATAVFSHGLSTNRGDMEPYARTAAANGMVTYVFDFCGSGQYSSSSEQPGGMSLFTEQHDLESVAWELSREPYVDENNLFLMGSSLGASITLMAARANADLVRGVVLLYPAFNLYDAVHAACPSRELLPDSFMVMSTMVSKAFLCSCWDYNFYDHIGAFPRDVLLFHGDADDNVPLSYSQRAAEIFPNAELHVIEGGKHGFKEPAYSEVVNISTDWLLAHINK